MAPSAIAQRRTHNLLLFQKLLNLRDGASPFTLMLDSLEQSAQPIVKEFMLRAKISKTKILFISFQTLRKPKNADIFVHAHRKPLGALREEILSHVPTLATPPTTAAASSKTLLVFDTLQPLATLYAQHLPTFLSSLLSPSTSLLAIYHTDIPIRSSSPSSALSYSPDSLSILLYLATAILRVSSLSHTVARRKARDKSHQEPEFGINEGREGVLVGLKGSLAERDQGVVVEMEVRRKSGRGVKEVFVLSPTPTSSTTRAISAASGLREPTRGGSGSKVILLDDHPLYSTPAEIGAGTAPEAGGEEVETTFNLGLTEKQRRDREGIVLPYFDAQNGEGAGEGGRILYEMGREDDFDEDEDDEF